MIQWGVYPTVKRYMNWVMWIEFFTEPGVQCYPHSRDLGPPSGMRMAGAWFVTPVCQPAYAAVALTLTQLLH